MKKKGGDEERGEKEKMKEDEGSEEVLGDLESCKHKKTD